MVPLAEAWASGASTWSPQRREDYANDVTYAASLNAVDLSLNRSKGDADPAEWLPPTTADQCRYVAEWVAVKARWSLTIDTAEKKAVKSVMNRCSTKSLTVPAPPRA